MWRLEIVNDGVAARHHGFGGHGLAGLATRAEELGGEVSTERRSGGRFVLVLDVPEVTEYREVTA